MTADIYKGLWTAIFGPNSDISPTSMNALVVNPDGSINTTTTVAYPAVTWTQTVVTLGAAASGSLIAANANRKRLRWMNIGSNPMTVVPGAGPAVVGQGMQYEGSSGAGHQGGADTFKDDTSTQAFTAISTLGTTVVVWEGT